MPAPQGNKNAQQGDEPAESKVQLRVTRRQKAKWVRAAQNQGGLSAWAKETLDRQAAKDLGEESTEQNE